MNPNPRDRLVWSQFPLYAAQFRQVVDGTLKTDVDWEHLWWEAKPCRSDVDARNRIHRIEAHNQAVREHAVRSREIAEHNALVDAGLRPRSFRRPLLPDPPMHPQDLELTDMTGQWEPITVYAKGSGTVMIVPTTVPKSEPEILPIPLILKGDPDALHPEAAAALAELHNERQRAHRLHHDKPGGSMEAHHWNNPDWSDVLGEELGEVNKARNDYRHGLIDIDEYQAQLRKELIQLGSLATAWIAAIDGNQLDPITPKADDTP